MAIDSTWIGEDGIDYHDGSNWFGGQVPTGTATFDSGAFNFSVSIGSPAVELETWDVTGGNYSFTVAAAVTLDSSPTASLLVHHGAIASISLDAGGSFTAAGIANQGTLTFGTTISLGNEEVLTEEGVTAFSGHSTGGNAEFVTHTGGKVDFSGSIGAAGDHAVSAGSISGVGDYYLGQDQLTVGSNDLSTEMSGVIHDGSIGNGNVSGGSLAKVGTGTLTLSGDNTYTGGTTVNGGTLRIGNDSALGSGTVTMAGGTTLALATTGDFMIANGIKLQGDPTFFVDSGHTDALLGNIADASAGVHGDLVKTGAGNLVLGGDNNYTGATIVEAGTLAAGSSSGFSAASAFAVAAGAVLDVGGFQVTIGSLSDAGGSGGIVKDGDTLAAGLTTGADNRSTSFSGTIEDGVHVLSLTKVGTGTFTLAGANAYSGVTTVSAGTLQVDGSITSATVVRSHAKLRGDGTTGAINVLAHGRLAPGDQEPGILHTGNVVLHAHAHLDVRLGSHHHSDQLEVSGSINLGRAILDLSLLGGFHPAVGKTFDIIDDDGTGPVHGRFAGLAQGATFAVDGVLFTINYHAHHHDVVLTALAPPPAPGWHPFDPV